MHARITAFAIAIICIIASLLPLPYSSAEPPQTRKQYTRSREFEKLQNKDLREADFTDTELTMTNLAGADLRKANFTGARLDRTILDGANLSDAIGLGSVDFGLGIDAEGAVFQRADFRNARIPAGRFDKADFRDANLEGAFLSGRFHQARFEGTNVRDAVFLGTSGTEGIRASLQARGAICTAGDLERSIRSGRDYSGTDLRGAQLANIALDDAPLVRTRLGSSDLTQATLRRARLSNAWLGYSKLSGADLTDADLTAADLAFADLSRARLVKARCTRAAFNRARLIDASLVGADLTNADMRFADLTGADLTDANLTGVNWDAAIIKDLRGLTPEQQASIKSQAARWKHDLAEWFHETVKEYSHIAWLVTWFPGLFVLYRTSKRSPNNPAVRIFFGLHSIAAIPILSFLFLFLTGSAPTAQMSGSFGGWSMWLSLWPLCMGLSILGLLAFLPLGIIALVICIRRKESTVRGYLALGTILTGLALASATGFLTQLMPTA